MNPLGMAFVLASWPVSDYALGDVLQHALSVCVEKADAVAVLEVAKKSHAEADALFLATAGCSNIPVVGFKVGRVVWGGDVQRANGSVGRGRVVEIIDPDTQAVVAYFITTRVGGGEHNT
jgi:hypothetical protein